MAQVVRRAPVISFVVASLAISWAIWTPLVFGSTRSSSSVAWLCYFGGVIGPAAAAVVCAVLGSDVTPAALLRRLRRWRVPFIWCVTVILLPFLIRGLAVAAVMAARPPFTITFRPAESIAQITVLMLLLVPFEEIGWRGYLLPLLQQRHTFLASSIVGGIWALWHLPLPWASIGFQRGDEPWRYMVFFAGSVIPVSYLLTWLFNGTGASVVAVLLFHIAVNLADFTSVAIGELVLLVTSLLTALVVTAIWLHQRGDQTHSRGA